MLKNEKLLYPKNMRFEVGIAVKLLLWSTAPHNPKDRNPYPEGF
jgi:hypothetical protein